MADMPEKASDALALESQAGQDIHYDRVPMSRPSITADHGTAGPARSSGAHTLYDSTSSWRSASAVRLVTRMWSNGSHVSGEFGGLIWMPSEVRSTRAHSWSRHCSWV